MPDSRRVINNNIMVIDRSFDDPTTNASIIIDDLNQSSLKKLVAVEKTRQSTPYLDNQDRI